jgi:energy-coupling factor transport system permease protein
MGLTLALLIVVVNALVVSRGETVLARLGEWPLFGQVEVTAEAIAAGAVIGLRAAVVMVAFAVYSACVDPDRVLRALRPVAGRSALTATLVSRLVPVAAADAGRLRDAAQLRGPGAAPVGRAPLARRLLAGSLDRAVDVAATLELRGYSLKPPAPPAGVTRYPASGRTTRYTAPRAPRPRPRSRYDGRFYAIGGVVLAAAIAGKLAGADAFSEYPTVEIGAATGTLALSCLIGLSGLAPRRPRVRRGVAGPRSTRTASTSPPSRWRS